MKTLLTVFCFALWASVALALNITTRDGKSYSDAEVKSVEREGVRIVHRDGTATIDFDNLPADLQAKYGWTAEKSSARGLVRNALADAKRKAAEGERAVSEKAYLESLEARKRAEERERLSAENEASAERYREQQKQASIDAANKRIKEQRESEQMAENIKFGGMLLLAFIFAFLPAFIARGKPQFGGVLLLNILVFVGAWGQSYLDDPMMRAADRIISAGMWITALVMALQNKKREMPSVINVTVIQAQPPQPRPVVVPRVVAKAVPTLRNPPTPPKV